jgi:hypothetical protein
MTNYVIGISPPRSGTAWLSNFLTWGDCFIHHEALFGMESLDKYQKLLDSMGTGMAGSMDTAASYIVPALYSRFPDAKFLMLVRPQDEVEKSCLDVGLGVDISACYEGLQWAREHIDNLLIVDYRNLFNQITMREIWDYIEHPEPFPWQRMEMLRGMYVEDGFRTGFGRFTDEAVVAENVRCFETLYLSCEETI